MKRSVLSCLKFCAFALALIIPMTAMSQQVQSGQLTLVNQNGNPINGTYTATAHNGVQTGLYWTINGVPIHFNIPPGGFARTNTLTTRAVQSSAGWVGSLTVHFQTARSGTWSDNQGQHGTFIAN